MKKVLTGCAGVVVMVMAAGCASPTWPGVSVDTYSLRNDIAVQSPTVSRVGEGQLQVEIPVRNRTNKEIDLEYKYHFVDANGVQVEGDKAWLSKRVPPRGMEDIAFTSLTSSANDFRVQMRRNSVTRP